MAQPANRKNGATEKTRLPVWLTAAKSGTLLRLHVHPGAKSTEIAGLHGDRLKVRLAAPPVKGKANRELCTYISSRLNIPRSAVTLARGATGRQKELLVDALTPAAVKSRLGG